MGIKRMLIRLMGIVKKDKKGTKMVDNAEIVDMTEQIKIYFVPSL
jgi:hypothetical protein